MQSEYKKGNTDYLNNLVNYTLPSLRKLYNDFYEEYKSDWLKYNKSIGIERTVWNFGSIDYRLRYIEATLKNYLDGSISLIEELEQITIGGINRIWAEKEDYMYLIQY